MTTLQEGRTTRADKVLVPVKHSEREQGPMMQVIVAGRVFNFELSRFGAWLAGR